MIFLSHYELESKLEISPNKINIFTVENNKKFFQYCKELICQQNGGDGNFALFDDKGDYTIAKSVKVIFDYFTLDLNEKKMQNTLFNSIEPLCKNELYVDYSNTLSALVRLMDKINTLSEFEIEFNEIMPLTAILKAMSARVKNDSSEFLSHLVNYIEFCSKLLGVKLIVLVNLKTFLSEEEIEQFYKQMILDEINIVLFENTLRTKLQHEYITVIDKDLCEIII